MRKLRLLLAFVFLFSFAQAKGPVLVDQAQIFSLEEREKLTDKLNKLSSQLNMDILILTARDTGGKTTRDFLDLYWEEYGYGENGSGIALIYDMQNREVQLLTEGKGKKLLDDKINALYDTILDSGLTEQRYFDSANSYLDKVKSFTVKTVSIVEGLIAVIASFGAGLGSYFTTKLKYSSKARPVAYDFRSNSVANFVPSQDSLIDQNITSRLIVRERASSSSSGGTTTRQSSTGSGRTYGGGSGRKF